MLRNDLMITSGVKRRMYIYIYFFAVFVVLVVFFCFFSGLSRDLSYCRVGECTHAATAVRALTTYTPSILCSPFDLPSLCTV